MFGGARASRGQCHTCGPPVAKRAARFPWQSPCSSLTLCSVLKRTRFQAKYRTFMFEKTRFNCWWLDRQIGMYLHGEHFDPVKHFSAKKMENHGICHLTQQEPGAEGAQLGKSAAGLFFFFFFFPPPGCCCSLGSRYCL